MQHQKENEQPTEKVQLEVINQPEITMALQHIQEKIIPVRALYYEMNNQFVSNPKNRYSNGEDEDLLHAIYNLLNLL